MGIITAMYQRLHKTKYDYPCIMYMTEIFYNAGNWS